MTTATDLPTTDLPTTDIPAGASPRTLDTYRLLGRSGRLRRRPLARSYSLRRR